MKKWALLSVIFLVSGFSFAQNLVPNESFENVTQCPFAFDLEAFTSDWKSARRSPDYFNSCATAWIADVPLNDYGYQAPYNTNENAYIGMLTYRADSSINTEAVSVQLNSPLIIGLTYYVSFKVSLTLENTTGSMAANNKIGIQFSTIEYSPSNPVPINNFAHVWTDSIITDTINWTTIKSSFVADSAYSFLNLGNFFDEQNMDIITFGSVFGAYYYFDEVCVSTDSTLCYQTIGVKESDKEFINFSVYPNPANNQITIKFENNTGNSIAILFNSQGKLIRKIPLSNLSANLNVQDLLSGIYLLLINTENSIYQQKIIINH